MNNQLDTILALVEEKEVSIYKGDTDTNISKLFINIESQVYRRLERLANKSNDESGYLTFMPKLDFKITNPIVFSSRLANETYTFREIFK